MNIGSSSRLIYDECAYQTRTPEMTNPLLYRVNPHQIYNCQQCGSLNGAGPRASYMGAEVSTTHGHGIAPALREVDVESILSNRNLPKSKCKNGEVNPIDVTQFGLKHLPQCTSYLDPMASRLSYPAFNYREAPIDRFYNLPQNPQEPIFWDFATNTKLDAKDNYVYDISTLKSSDPTHPRAYPGHVDNLKGCVSGMICTK